MSFVETAVNILNNDGVILVPTDTHFAIAVNPYNQKTINWLIQEKTRLNVRDITFCFTDIEQIRPWVDVSHWERIKLELLSNAFWPGPLKVSVKAHKSVLNKIACGSVISVVCVKNTIIREIITKQSAPLAVIPAASYENGTQLVGFTNARESFGDIVDLIVPTNCKSLYTQATTHISLLDDTIKIIRYGELDVSSYL